MPNFATILAQHLYGGGGPGLWIHSLYLDYKDNKTYQTISSFAKADYNKYVFEYHPAKDIADPGPDAYIQITDGENVYKANTNPLQIGRSLSAAILTKTTVTIYYSGMTSQFNQNFIPCLDSASAAQSCGGKWYITHICVKDKDTGTTTCVTPTSVNLAGETTIEVYGDFDLTANHDYDVWVAWNDNGTKRQLTESVTITGISATDMYTVKLTISISQSPS